jgi:hypothetical protein
MEVPMGKAHTQLLKEINLDNVRRAMRQAGSATKPQLAEATGLSVVTIASLVKELIQIGEIYEGKAAHSTGGRRPVTYHYNYNVCMALLVILHVHKEEVLVSVINLNGDALKKQTHSVANFDVDEICAIVDEYGAAYPAIKMIGMGIPGQQVDGEMKVSSHENLIGARLTETIQQRCALPVWWENDINAALSGYCTKYPPNEGESVIGLFFPAHRPPGLGIYIDGKLFKGKNGMAGEIKFLPVDVDWYQPLESRRFTEVVCYTLQLLNAVLAPDKIIIYQHRCTNEQLLAAWQAHEHDHPMPVSPKVIVSDGFGVDFLRGLKAMVLRGLEEKAYE